MADHYKHKPIELTDSAKKRVKKKKSKLGTGLAHKASYALSSRQVRLDAAIDGATTKQHKASRNK